MSNMTLELNEKEQIIKKLIERHHNKYDNELNELEVYAVFSNHRYIMFDSAYLLNFCPFQSCSVCNVCFDRREDRDNYLRCYQILHDKDYDEFIEIYTMILED